jgi:hypothetical protein
MLTAVDTGDQIAVVAVIVGIATGLIAVAALVVAWKAREMRAGRRTPLRSRLGRRDGHGC